VNLKRGVRLSEREKSRGARRSQPKDLAPGEVVVAQWPAGLPYARFGGRIPRGQGELFLTDQRLVFDPTEEPARRRKDSSSGTWGVFAGEKFVGIGTDRGAARLEDISTVEETTGEHPLIRVVLTDGTEVKFSFRQRGVSWPGQKRRERLRLARDDAVQRINAALKARRQR
jgi:hypothetical protein